MKKLQITLLFLIFSLLGCEENNLLPNINKQDIVSVDNTRLDKLFYNGDEEVFHSEFLKYPELYENFYTKMIRAGSENELFNPLLKDTLTLPILREFLNDSTLKLVFKAMEEEFPDLTLQEEKISVGMSNYNSLFKRGIKEAKIGTFYSNFNATVIENDHVIWIGLEMYLGGENEIIKMLPPNTFPQYYKQKMDKKFMISDVFFSFLMSHHYEHLGDELLARMLAFGKIAYLMDIILPFEEEENKFRYSKEELEWCNSNEINIWRYIVDEKLLYESDPTLVDPFFLEGPFTKNFGSESPSTIGIWLGYKMIRDYAENNDVSIIDIVKEKNMQKLLKYYEP